MSCGLHPSMKAMWGTGDSDMHQYASKMDAVHHVGTLAELAAAIDRLLTT